MPRSKYTRSGARRAGDDYQDVVALELLIDWLEHPGRYSSVSVEADDAGALDDVKALRSDDTLVVKQVKFSTDPDADADPWTWERLLEEKQGKRQTLPSLLGRWSVSLRNVEAQNTVHEAALDSNRRAAPEIAATLSLAGLVNFDKITDQAVRHEIARQVGDETKARDFFSKFHFYVDRAGRDERYQAVRRRFHALGGTEQGWLNLNQQLRAWVRLRDEPPPDGAITLADVRGAALWYQLQSLPQDFAVPADYVLPSKQFHKELIRSLLAMKSGCRVVVARPGAGKSTYSSYLFRRLRRCGVAVVRHHYFLSLRDRTGFDRLDHRHAAESLMHDLARDYPEAVEGLGERNPNPADLGNWLEACGRYFTAQGQALVMIVDGLDHVWRDRGSVDELNQLFRHLLPAPEGVVVLLATQPVDESKLPLNLRRAAPQEEWWELPLLNRSAVGQWLKRHAEELLFSDDSPGAERYQEEVADALFNKSQGHPLHLRFTLKALQEQKMLVTRENVERLPGCPHQDITLYYRELWDALPEESREILHLLAACSFSWPRQGLLDCLASPARDEALVRQALRQVEHLLVSDDLGLRPFHGSLLVFVEALSDHADYATRMRRRALEWLRTEAPEHWRWGNEWLLEAGLGNEQPLRDGPTRAWAIEAIAKRRLGHEVDYMSARSLWAALEHRELPRVVEVGLLREYAGIAFADRRDVLSQLLYPQLIVAEDPYLSARLRSHLSDLADADLATLAVAEVEEGNPANAERCLNELNERWKSGRFQGPEGGQKDWRVACEPLMKMAALPSIGEPSRVVNFATGNRDTGFSAGILRIYAEQLRLRRDARQMRQLLKLSADFEKNERAVVFRQAVLLALEEDLDINQEALAPEQQADPLAAIYAALRGCEGFTCGAFPLPDEEAFSYRRGEQYERQSGIKALFMDAFWCLLANHLWNRSNRNSEWLYLVGTSTWPRRFAHKLNAVARDLAAMLSKREATSLKWLYDQLSDIPWPSVVDEDGVYVYGYANGSRQAVTQLCFDLSVLASAVGQSFAVGPSDVETAFASVYCHPQTWISEYLDRHRAWLTEEAVTWLLQNQQNRLASTFEYFPERASQCAALAGLAAFHGRHDDAKTLIREAASNLIAHGEHKDVLFFASLEVAEACHAAGIPEARSWLLQLAPAIARAEEYTDGRETGNLPRYLADALAKVAPDLLPTYYRWLCNQEEHYDALHAFRAFLRSVDLSSPLHAAIAKTAIDPESLQILDERAQGGVEGAAQVLASTKSLMGPNVLRIKPKRKSETSDPPRPPFQHEEQRPPEPADFPPERFDAYQEALVSGHFYPSSFYAQEWFKHWSDAGQGDEAFAALQNAVERGIDLGGYDVMFDFARRQYGKEDAYVWLVRAQRADRSWNRYSTREESAVQRWELVKRLYPNRWFDFFKDSIASEYGDPWHDLWLSHHRFARLVNYCLLMGQREVAQQVAAQMIASSLELVSPLRLPTPAWVPES